MPARKAFPLARLLSTRYVVWTLLALPAAYLSYRYWQGAVFYGEYLHATGTLAARLLIATMAVSPLRLMFPNSGWVRWLLARRRYLGVAAFGYSVLHAGAYLWQQPVSATLEDAVETGMWTGWLALALMLVLAVTSNRISVRVLRRGWKRLHRAVYAIAVLTFVHWILTAFDPVPGMIHAGVLLALEAFRLWRLYVKPARREAPRSATD